MLLAHIPLYVTRHIWPPTSASSTSALSCNMSIMPENRRQHPQHTSMVGNVPCPGRLAPVDYLSNARPRPVTAPFRMSQQTLPPLPLSRHNKRSIRDDTANVPTLPSPNPTHTTTMTTSPRARWRVWPIASTRKEDVQPGGNKLHGDSTHIPVQQRRVLDEVGHPVVFLLHYRCPPPSTNQMRYPVGALKSGLQTLPRTTRNGERQAHRGATRGLVGRGPRWCSWAYGHYLALERLQETGFRVPPLW